MNVCIKSLPISTRLSALTNSDTVFRHGDVPNIETAVSEFKSGVAVIDKHYEPVPRTEPPSVDDSTEVPDENSTDVHSRSTLTRNVRPDQEITHYLVELTADGDSFTGKAVIEISLSFATREDPMVLHVEGLDIQSVMVGVFNLNNPVQADFNVDDGLLEIEPPSLSTSYILDIEYTGSLSTVGRGFFRGEYNEL